jgi:hypothetical protein
LFFAGRMSKFVRKLKGATVLFRATRSLSSSRVGFEMEVDPPSPVVGSSSCLALEETFTLLRDKQIKFQDDRELKDREVTHTPVSNHALLQLIAMDFKFELVFKNVGWENDWELNDQGCKLLTIEFLCTLQHRDTEVSFRLFNKEFSPSQKNFSRFMGFLEQCTIDIVLVSRGLGV